MSQQVRAEGRVGASQQAGSPSNPNHRVLDANDTYKSQVNSNLYLNNQAQITSPRNIQNGARNRTDWDKTDQEIDRFNGINRNQQELYYDPRPGVMSLDYQKKVKTQFSEIILLKEGEQEEAITQIPKRDYAEKKMKKNPAYTEPLALPSDEFYKVAEHKKYRAVSRYLKSGWCGSKTVNSVIDMEFDPASNEINMNNAQGFPKVQISSVPNENKFKGDLNVLKFKSVSEEVAKQNQPEEKKKIAENPYLKIDIPEGEKPQYMLSFIKGDIKNEKLFLFMKDDDEINMFRNTILAKSKIGRRFCEGIERGEAGLLPHLIKRSHVIRAELFLEQMYRALEAKRNEIERMKKRMSHADRAKWIKRIVRMYSIKTLMKENLSDVEKKKKACLRLFKNVSMGTAQGTKIYVINKWKTAIAEMRKEEIKVDKQEVVLSPQKYYDLFPQDEDRNELNSLNLDQINLVVSHNRYDQGSIFGTKFPEDRVFPLEMLPSPSGSGLQSTEFNILSHNGAVDLSNFMGNYLIAYVYNMEDRKVTAYGDMYISPKLGHTVFLELKNQELTDKQTLQPTVTGTLVFKRHDVDLPMMNDPKLTNLMDGRYFGYMKKYYKWCNKDMGIATISRPVGVGERYREIKNYMNSEAAYNSDLLRFESKHYKIAEWSYFNATIQKICREARGNPTNPLVLSKNDFLNELRLCGFTNSNIPRAEDPDFLFFSREKWRDIGNFVRKREIVEKSMITGMPEHYYIPVWKSMGKFPLIYKMVTDLYGAKTSLPQGSTVYSMLAKEGEQELKQNPNVEKDIAEMDMEYNLTSNHLRRIRSDIQAFLRLSIIMEDVSMNASTTTNLFKGFGLRTVGGICHIVRNLVRLTDECKKHSADKVTQNVQEEDSFWVLLSLSFVFLPEHFLCPIQAFEVDSQTRNTHQQLAKLGIDATKLSDNKMFLSSSAVGSYKLGLILAQCIQKEHQKVYEKMCDLGFPFMTYCLDLSDNLFSDFFNDDLLCKVWHVIFFEGADVVKRRAQQIILSAIMTVMNDVSDLILESKSSEEIKWHLKAYGLMNSQSTQFVSDTYKVRKSYFVKSNSTGMLGKLSSMFAGGKSIEEEFQEIKSIIIEDFKVVGQSNKVYFTFVDEVLNNLQARSQIDLHHIRNFMSSFIIDLDKIHNTYALKFINMVSNTEYNLKEKPRVNDLLVSVSSWDFGNYLAENTHLSINTNFSSKSVKSRITDPSWYRIHRYDGKSIQAVEHSWIEFEIQSTDKEGNKHQFSKCIELTSLRFNRPAYFTIRDGSLWITVMLRLGSDAVHLENKDYFKELDHELLHKSSLFCEDFANKLDIKRETPFVEEILYHPLENSECLMILSYVYKANIGKLKPDFITKVLNNDLFDKKKPNLFEFLARIILFSRLDNSSILRLLFQMLTKVDLTSYQHKVKRSHVEFLIWYILRLSQVYVPYNEIVESVSNIYYGAQSHVVSAVIMSVNDTSKPSLDVTDLMNLWVVAQRRRTGRAMIKLGSKGTLENLDVAIKWWLAERSQASYIYSKKNKLTVFANCEGQIRRFEFIFDDKMKLEEDFKDRDIQIESDQVILLEDTELRFSFHQFTKVVSQFQILDWVFSRLTRLEHDGPTKTNDNTNYEVVVKFRRKDETGFTDIGLVHLTKMTVFKAIDIKQNINRRNFLIDNQYKITFGKEEIPRPLNSGILESSSKLLEIIESSLFIVRKDLLDHVNTDHLQFKFRRESLDLLSLEIDKLTIQVENNILNPNRYYTTLEEIYRQCKTTGRLHIDATILAEDIEPIYNHMAKDIYYLEGVNVVENPLVPCQIIEQSDSIATVVFETDSEKRQVPLEDVVL